MSDSIALLREKCPLVHCITNYVTVNDVANAILAIGGSPIMADDIAEAGDITAISNALVINIGTLNARTVESMIAAGKRANEKDIPVVLDPVGAGASSLRSGTVDRLVKEVKFTIIRGNLSEVSYIAGLDAVTRGVDSGMAEGDADAVSVAKKVSSMTGAVAVITGRIDTIAYGSRLAAVSSGTAAMSRITGTGCMLSGITGAFAGAYSDPFVAAVSAVASMGASGVRAYERTKEKGTGSFHIAIIDELSRMTDEILSAEGGIEYVS